MSNYTINYIVYTPGHRRHHAGTQTQLIPAASGQSNQGENFPVFAFSALPYLNSNLQFAFMSIVGNADTNHLYTTPGNKDVLTGTQDIKITIVYAPAGGGDGKGGPAIWVDAFNVDTGNFSDSDFMQVFTNGSLDNAKTFTANEEGIVSSVIAEDMRSNTAVDGVPFLQWEKIGGTNVTNTDYMLAINEGGIAFAFYQTGESFNLPTVDKGLEWIFVSPGVRVGGDGFVIGADGKIHHVDPRGPFIAQLLSTLVILSISSTMTSDVKKQAIQLAASHLESLKNEILNAEI